MVLASIFFAWMGVSIKMTDTHHTVFSLMAWRVLPSVLVFGSWAIWRKKNLYPLPFKRHAGRAGAGFCSMIGAFYASQHLPLAIATVLQYTAPLFVVIELTWNRQSGRSIKDWGSILIGFFGVLWVLHPRLDRYDPLAIGAGLLAGLSASIAYSHVRGLGSVNEPEWRTLLVFSSLVLIASLLMILIQGDSRALLPTGPRDLCWLISIGLSGMMAQFLLTRAYSRGSALLTANLQFLTIVFAAVFGFYGWGDAIDSGETLGIALNILCGIIATFSAQHQKKSSQT